MAELASGAVRSLLGVLRDEARLLGRVEGDLKFIQEEMESMNSFLQHLDRTTPPGEHDEQVRTWMKQVRDLAYACSNCIDLYLLRGDRAAYRFTGPVGRYLTWVPWYLQKLYAQHRAAIQLRELKDRARDVGKRRLRYDVKIPTTSGPEATSSSSQAAGGEDAGTILGDDERTPEVEAFSEPRILEECTQELVNWLSNTEEIARPIYQEDRFQSIAIAAPDKADGADVAREALADPSVATKFKHQFWINFPMFWITFPFFLPAMPMYILEKILRELLPEAREDEWAKTEEIAKKIKEHLEGKRTIIVLDGISNAYGWKETKRALNQLGCAAGSAVIVTTKYTQGSEEFCHPRREAIIYSLVHFYYMKVLTFISRRKNRDCHVDILHEILQLCDPHELCMKLFVYALYANPDKSREDLEKLREDLEELRDTLVFSGPLDIYAKKIFMFSYGDLPRDYKTCLLYLAIFPPGWHIRRSTLVGRWVAEGVILKEDWPSSMHRAEQCFDALVDRRFVCPYDIGAAGKVKSCTVDDLVIDFITRIARKEHFVETRLSRHLARHFSVLSDVQLRTSEDMPKFLRKLYTSPQYPLVKVLDLEGCKYFQRNQNYLKNICNKMLLLKYLSLRNTDITKLPKEINNLHQLEVLDIRQTKVRAHATKDVLLLKLKRLLAGHIDLIPISSDSGTVRAEESFSSVQIPGRIEKMTNMEVLSHVKASRAGHELKDIGKLWQLRKLGVVIKDENDHLGNLLQAISDLNECLQSLSITLPRSEGIPSSVDLPREIRKRLRRPPKLLESLSISGITTNGHLLPLLASGRGKLTKLTLRCTRLNQDHLKDLGQLPKLRCVRLRHVSYTESKLTFENGEFQNLKYFLVEGSNMTEISFEDGAAPKLEKIVLSSTNMNSISFEDGAAPELEKIVFSFADIKYLHGVDRLPKLEVELNGNRLPLPLFDNANLISKVTLRDILLKQGDLQILAKNPNMRCLMLLDKSCDESQLTFNKDDFPKLSLLVVECDGITNISFSNGAAPKLEKIVWSFTSMESLSGIDNIPRLKELEFNGENVPDEVIKAIKAHPKRPVLKHNIPQNED